MTVPCCQIVQSSKYSPQNGRMYCPLVTSTSRCIELHTAMVRRRNYWTNMCTSKTICAGMSPPVVSRSEDDAAMMLAVTRLPHRKAVTAQVGSSPPCVFCSSVFSESCSEGSGPNILDMKLPKETPRSNVGGRFASLTLSRVSTCQRRYVDSAVRSLQSLMSYTYTHGEACMFSSIRRPRATRNSS